MTKDKKWEILANLMGHCVSAAAIMLKKRDSDMDPSTDDVERISEILFDDAITAVECEIENNPADRMNTGEGE